MKSCCPNCRWEMLVHSEADTIHHSISYPVHLPIHMVSLFLLCYATYNTATTLYKNEKSITYNTFRVSKSNLGWKATLLHYFHLNLIEKKLFVNITENERKNLRLDYKEFHHIYTQWKHLLYFECASRGQMARNWDSGLRWPRVSKTLNPFITRQINNYLHPMVLPNTKQSSQSKSNYGPLVIWRISSSAT